jgi:hypothetical protein
MANAERVKDAAEADRYGYPSVEGAMDDGCKRPRPECSASSGGTR